MTKKKKSASDYLMMVLMGMLIVGLGGFGITSFSGGGSTIGTVGDRDITVEDYFRAMTQAVRNQEAAGATDLSLAAIQARGVPQQVRAQLVATAAIDNEADRLGLSVGDAEVARMITQSPAFQGVDGTFDREAYEYMLEQNGWNVADFEQDVREESTRNILQAGVATGVAPPAQYIDTLAAWFGERRSFRWVAFGPENLANELPEPSEADLAAHHAENEAAFTLPEMKRISYVWLSPAEMTDEIEIDEEALRALYAERADLYIVPERRLVERVVFGTADEAAEAKRAIEAGETDFQSVVEDRGLELADVDLGDVTEADLGEAGVAVFGLEEPGIVGPYPTELGPALFRMNAVLQARETSFEDARDELRQELGREEARALIENMISDLDDRLAGGATIEDLAAETEMEAGTIDWWENAEGGLAAYDGFREAAAELTEQDFPEILTLADGGIYAMRLDEMVPARLQPLDEVREAVRAGWEAAKIREMLMAEAEAARTALDNGDTLVDVAGLAVETVENATRATIGEAAPLALAETVFALDEGASEVVELADGAALVVLDAIAAADPDDPQVALFRQAIEQQSAQGIASDLFVYYAQYLTATAGISIDQAAINSVHSQLFR